MTGELSAAPSMNFAPGGQPGADILGSTTPRLWTPPIRELGPETSYGYDVAWFAEHVIGEPLDPWQEWAAVHIGELLPDGRPRFRRVLVIVARQQGKSHLARALTLYWLFIEKWPLILGLNATLGYAKEQWQMVCHTATDNEWLAKELPSNAIRSAAGEECLTTIDRCRYKIAAANRRAGRSLTIDRIIADELREQRGWAAWNASNNAMNARPNGQLIAITNQGDDESVVLNALRAPAIEYIETGSGDYRLGLFEWSAPAGSRPTDLDALAMSNPNLGRRTDAESLLGDAVRAEKAGGVELAGFKTEVMCVKVDTLNPAIDVESWNEAAGDIADLAAHRKQVALCLDVSLDGRHASLVAAATVEGVTHVDTVAAWSGPRCVTECGRELPGLVRKIKPRVIGWFPAGPAAGLARFFHGEAGGPAGPGEGAP